ncbi:LuxR C-terminal-related transcriptional regulator [Variovorax sp. J22P168]|uniref:response regulator transcription factor n=1 Tax=Variovorax jilinensis TaxID=3053513 RepID=UPI002578405A|nr:response regulator [Variovorax sp. J22P168]MDM0014466.1 LuxR C-terminal-related transcriptional regulator [Variovorax sp. J22P168]
MSESSGGSRASNTFEHTVFVVDDDASVRTGLERLARSVGWQAESFPSADAFLERLPISGIACLLLDVQMPGTSGPELQALMLDGGWSLPVIFLTGQGDVPTCAQSMKNGAVDFLQKPVDDEVLLDALRRGLARHQAERSREQLRSSLQDHLDRLSPRESEVLAGVLAGRLNKQIAADMDISEKTVKVHRARVMEKMGVRSVAELVRLCGAGAFERSESVAAAG